jgi:hypothetical protein
MTVPVIFLISDFVWSSYPSLYISISSFLILIKTSALTLTVDLLVDLIIGRKKENTISRIPQIERKRILLEKNRHVRLIFDYIRRVEFDFVKFVHSRRKRKKERHTHLFFLVHYKETTISYVLNIDYYIIASIYCYFFIL